MATATRNTVTITQPVYEERVVLDLSMIAFAEQTIKEMA